ncbi:hypothetical protein CGCF415_v011690 [Colletotrichum fructicola]|uniref:Uncharacterized protein n=1 Tax=Colletotrichum fructicola (strain Nara gc5) TaxID=1213859 RepID=L2FN19_COLFN|nr:uncharacterized protein CGMCC3_g3394 [Colletotrichum fructicola]KAF4479416.1 hypothetical protein CGGC5_v012590 [Colletotrichum fructicola Nara gc5]KAE9580657.1 hypothetical protein CGMCC3_g3394 [Colletotrichum fructicola]KAF4422883.1 hypothetical protein CFRS1_v001154 [Colletotrichum fructicola]KAF4896032.1 hypothetical protein CGCF415_v011690 [Colletotrichum fructicola]KAF4900845.1 hypothetical protein CGCFRS4_v003134 [Colletotrichum fructicola]
MIECDDANGSRFQGLADAMRLADFSPLPGHPRTLMIHTEHGGIRVLLECPRKGNIVNREPEHRPLHRQPGSSPEAAMDQLGTCKEYPLLRDMGTINFLLQSKVTRMFETTQLQPALSQLPLLKHAQG